MKGCTVCGIWQHYAKFKHCRDELIRIGLNECELGAFPGIENFEHQFAEVKIPNKFYGKGVIDNAANKKI